MTKEEYQFASKTGDRVRMPDGTIGTVHTDLVCGGCCKRVIVKPDGTGFWGRVKLFFTQRNVFYDEDINTLEKIS